MVFLRFIRDTCRNILPGTGRMKHNTAAMLSASVLLSLLMIFPAYSFAQQFNGFKIARLSYRGGGDWYNDPSALTNLIDFTKKYVNIDLNIHYDDVAIGSHDLFNYPWAFVTGHGDIVLNDAEARNLREYLDNGGFLYIDDDFGFDSFIRKAIKKVYPDEKFVELPFSHPIYHQVFQFPHGVPKIHKHLGLPPQGFAIFRNGRMVIYYTYESNLADGWTNQDVHHDPQWKRLEALKMGVNLLVYTLTQP